MAVCLQMPYLRWHWQTKEAVIMQVSHGVPGLHNSAAANTQKVAYLRSNLTQKNNICQHTSNRS